MAAEEVLVDIRLPLRFKSALFLASVLPLSLVYTNVLQLGEVAVLEALTFNFALNFI